MSWSEKDRELLQQKQVVFEPAGKFESPGSVEALQLEDGTILMCKTYAHHGISGAVMGVYRKFLKAKIVVLHGTWVFIPDVEESDDESIRPDETEESA